MRKIYLAVALLSALLITGCHRGVVETKTPPTLTLARTIVLTDCRGALPDSGVPGRIDHMAYDPETQRLFVAALENGSLEVIDLEKGERVGRITGLQEPQDIAFVAGGAYVAVCCGGDGRMHIYDKRTLEEKAVIDVGEDADNVRYNAKTQMVLVAWGNEQRGAIAVFADNTWRRLADYKFASKPESFQLDPNYPRLFANLPAGITATRNGTVATLDLRSGIVNKMEIEGVSRNFPMAYDAQHERLFIVFRWPAGRLLSIDMIRRAQYRAAMGAAPEGFFTQAACGEDADDLFFDAGTNRVIVIAGGPRDDMPDIPPPDPGQDAVPISGQIVIFSVGANFELTRIASTLTAPHARTGLFVPSRKAIYVAVPMQGDSDPEIREYTLE